MADIKPDDIPFVMSKQVGIADANGKPTTAMLDWFQALWGWMKRSVVDLTTKVTTLTDQVGDNTAAITEEQTARIEGDTALAGQITTVEASVGDISADGAVYLAAKAAPSGATAAYGWYLTAGNAYAGMQAIALSGGGSAIGFTANQFYFTDAGTAQAVFTYIGGGRWVLNGAMIIRSGASGERVEITNQGVYCYDGAGTLRVEVGFLT